MKQYIFTHNLVDGFTILISEYDLHIAMESLNRLVVSPENYTLLIPQK